MPSIPKVSSITRVAPSLEAPVITPSVSNIGAGTEAIGAGMVQLGRGLAKRDLQDRDDTFNSARLNMANALHNEINAYDQDDDYDTIESRSEASVNESLGTIAAGITNEDDRARFIESQKLPISRARTTVGNVAFGKRKSAQRGIIGTQLQDSRETALTGDMGEVSGLVRARLDSAVANGYYSAEEADDVYSKWQTSAATGKLEMLPPEARVEALKLPWADNLPSDTRAKYQRLAEAEIVKNQAITKVDSLMETEISLDDGMAIIQAEIDDPALRLATEARFKTEHAVNEQAKADYQNGLYDKYSGMIQPQVGQGIRVDEIPADDWDAMPTSMRVNLRNMQTKPRGTSDPNALNRAVQLSANGRWGDLQTFISNNSSMLSAGDTEQYLKAAADGMAPASVTDSQLIKGVVVGDSTADKELRNQMLVTVNSWRNDFVANYGKEPTPDQTEQQVRRLVMDHDRDPDAFFLTETTEIYNLEGMEQARALNQVHMTELQVKDPENFAMTQQYIERRGTSVDRFEFEEIYRDQSMVTSIYRRDRVGYDDVTAYFDGRNVNPTHGQFLKIYDALMRQRNESPPSNDMIRTDGSAKGEGFFGRIKMKGGSDKGKVMTEQSIGVDFGDGEIPIPSLVPTLTKAEIDYLANGGKAQSNASIKKKAIAHAKKRMKAGMSPFIEEGEEASQVPD